MRSTLTARRRALPGAFPQTEAKIRTIEAEVVSRLSGEERPPTRVELEQTIGGSPLDVSNALHNLAVAGLIVLGELRVALAPGRATRPLLATVTPLRLQAGAGHAARTSTLPTRELAAGRTPR